MNYKTVFNISVLVFIVMLQNACVFIPQTATTTSYNNKSCSTVTSEWDIKMIPFDGPGFQCGDEACVAVFIAVPVVTAVVSFPIVAIGNAINFVEKQFRCN